MENETGLQLANATRVLADADRDLRVENLKAQLIALIEELTPISIAADRERTERPDDDLAVNRAREIGILMTIPVGDLATLTHLTDSVDLSLVAEGIGDVRRRLGELMENPDSAGNHNHRISKAPPEPK